MFNSKITLFSPGRRKKRQTNGSTAKNIRPSKNPLHRKIHSNKNPLHRKHICPNTKPAKQKHFTPQKPAQAKNRPNTNIRSNKKVLDSENHRWYNVEKGQAD
jgi:hypothetical protein